MQKRRRLDLELTQDDHQYGELGRHEEQVVPADAAAGQRLCSGLQGRRLMAQAAVTMDWVGPPKRLFSEIALVFLGVLVFN
ncbi:MAG: hypothetical protein FJ197_04830 [Gammaproteobacteria bacterium]|nr:hypothetical protein [Gammaproteobacteria bacterium]